MFPVNGLDIEGIPSEEQAEGSLAHNVTEAIDVSPRQGRYLQQRQESDVRALGLLATLSSLPASPSPYPGRLPLKLRRYPRYPEVRCVQ